VNEVTNQINVLLHTAAVAMLCVTDRAGVQPRRRPSRAHGLWSAA